jgi:hypothetical protein
MLSLTFFFVLAILCLQLLPSWPHVLKDVAKHNLTTIPGDRHDKDETVPASNEDSTAVDGSVVETDATIGDTATIMDHGLAKRTTGI